MDTIATKSLLNLVGLASTEGQELAPQPVGRTRRVLVVPILALLTGCSTVYYQLKPEREIPVLGDLAQAARDLPSRTRLFVVAQRDGKPIRMAIEEKGFLNEERVIVFVHGVLTNRSMWRFIVGDLGCDHNVLLIDLPGSGDSDKPDPAVVGEEFYAPDSLARVTLESLRQQLDGRRATLKITLVGHSLGGAVVLRMLANPELRREYADVLDRVDGAVLLSPLDVVVERQYADLKEIATLSDAKTGIAILLGLIQRQCAQATHDFSVDASRMPREEADRLIAILENRKTRHAQQAMLRQALPFHSDGRPDFEKMFELSEQYRNVRVPCLILWGRRDAALSVSMGYRMVWNLPQAWLRILPTCTHALPCERPVLCAALMRSFIRTGCPAFAVTGGVPVTEKVARLDDTLPESRAVEAAVVAGNGATPPAPERAVARLVVRRHDDGHGGLHRTHIWERNTPASERVSRTRISSFRLETPGN
jgi:pimeloyl-ACP methyl ester carboxylesterase